MLECKNWHCIRLHYLKVTACYTYVLSALLVLFIFFGFFTFVFFSSFLLSCELIVGCEKVRRLNHKFTLAYPSPISFSCVLIEMPQMSVLFCICPCCQAKPHDSSTGFSK